MATFLTADGPTTYTVTNLNDSGAGSLREAVTTPGVTFVTFAVSGNIELHSRLYINTPGITIDGMFAPKGGICVKDHDTYINAPNVTLRHLRFRVGAASGTYLDSLYLTANADNALIEHCSFSWSVDECFQITSKNVEVRYCIFSEPLSHSVHPDDEHSKAAWWAYGATNILFHHNLIAHSTDRNPLLRSGDCIVANNVLYNVSIPLQVHPYENPIRAHILGNIMIDGVDTWPDKNPSYRYMMRVITGPLQAPYLNDSYLYVKGNICGKRPTNDLDEFLICDPAERGRIFTTPPSLWRTFEADEVSTVLDTVLAHAGASPRDAVDARIVLDVQNQTGTIIDDPSEVGGWPDLTN